MMAGRFREVRTAASVSDLLDDGAQAVDLRDAAAFAAGHLTGAVNSDPLLLEEKSAVFVLYGAGGGDANEYLMASILEFEMFTNVIYYVGGWADWTASAD